MRVGTKNSIGLVSMFAIAGMALGADLSVGNIRLVEQKRDDRFVEESYRADITSAAGSYTNVAASVSSNDRGATVLHGIIVFPDVPEGKTVTSTGTFTIKHDIDTPFDIGALQFQASGTPASGKHPPSANAGRDQTVAVGSRVTLNGSASNDPDGRPLKYSWDLISVPPGSTASLLDSNSFQPVFIADKPGSYTVRLLVDDGGSNSSTDTVVISTLNSAPVANAGPNQTVHTGTSVSLNGSGSADVDGDPLRFSWTLISKPQGSAAELSDPAAAMPSFNIDVAGSYVAELVVNDGRLASRPSTVTIDTANSRPVANAGPDQTAFVSQTVRLDGSRSTDIDGQALTFHWSLLGAPSGSSGAISDPSAASPTMTIDRPGSYVVQLVVNDGASDSLPGTATITTVNSPPVAHAGPHQTIEAGSTVQLNGSASSDVDGNALKFAWAITSRPAESTAILSDARAVMPTFTADVPGRYIVQLMVNDGTANSAPDTVVIDTSNAPPVASAGPDQTVTAGGPVILDGSGSTDVDGNLLNFTWSFVKLPPDSSAVLSEPSAVMPAFTADVPGEYVVQLVVNDGMANSAPDTVRISTTRSAPKAHAGLDQRTAVGSYVQLNGTASSAQDGAALSYRWALTSRPAGSSASLGNANAATPGFTADVAGTYVAQLVVTDGVLESTPRSVVINTANVPPVAHAGPDQTVPVGSTVHLDGSQSSDADGQTLTYSWSITSRPTGSTAVLTAPKTKTPSFVADQPGMYVAQLIVNDGVVNSAPDTVVIKTQNRPPAAHAGPDNSMVIGTPLQLDGSASSDPDGNPLTYAWTIKSAPLGSTAKLTKPATAKPSLPADVPGVYVIQLIVNDGTVNSTPDLVTVLADTVNGGPLLNGFMVRNAIDSPGKVDTFTFQANAGDRIDVHVGEIVDHNDFRPWIRLQAPNGTQLASTSGVAAAAIADVAAPSTGTYKILVASFDSGLDGTGTYRLTMARSSGPVYVAAGDEGGPLDNGGVHTGAIVQGDVDVWTFTATAGDRIDVHIGEVTDNNDFRPWIRVWAPNGASLGSTSGVEAAALDGIVAPATGTYFVLVASFDSGLDGTGTYRLKMVKTPPPITVSPGDQGGPLTNGGVHTGEIVRGDVDVWTFSAAVGERIAVGIGETRDDNDFRPWIRVWAPNGAQLGSTSGVSAAALDGIVAPVGGTYLVLVASFNSGLNGTGAYRLNIAKTSGPVKVSGGDQGGPAVNGAIETGEIVRGDIDVWTFTATAGQRIGVHIGETRDDNDFRPWIRVWAPNGASLGSTSGVSAAALDGLVAPMEGRYLVLVSSFDSGLDGTGAYRLTIAKTGDPVTVSSGDQGGALVNGATQGGEILQGDLDVWTFSAGAGDRIAVNIGETRDDNDFRPWIRVWAPNGASLGSTSGVSAAVLDGLVAPLSGTYLVLVASFDSGLDGTGAYNLTIAKTGSPVTVSGGDQGGPLTSGVAVNGGIQVGDLDVWTISAAAGQKISAQVSELTDNNDFRPWIRIWAPNGASLGSTSGVSTAALNNLTAPVSGTYLVMISSFDSGLDGTGTYQLTATISGP